jgi:2,5-furandicarboxylate decarboxylase 1
MGLDATRPAVYHEHVFTKVRIPGEAEIELANEVRVGVRINWQTGALQS